MTISSTLNAGVAGLTANASRLSTIADNIANSSTLGYKRVSTDFHSMVVNQAGSRYIAGGVRTTSMRLIDERGSLVSSTNATDLAINGRGFLPVTTRASLAADNGTLPMNLVTTGSFRPDAQGYLVSPAGHVLMGWPAEPDGVIPSYPRDTSAGLEPVRINANAFSGKPTSEMSVSVNLPATATESTSDGDVEELSVEYYDNLGRSQSVLITFTPTVPATGTSNEWTMVVSDAAQGGAVIGEYTLTFDDSRADGGTLASVTAVTGGAYDPLTGTVGLTLAGGPLDLNIGLLNDPTGMTQLSDTFAPTSVTKNGFPVSNLTTVEVDSNGFVYAFFETGRSTRVYQVPLVDVPNPNGLESLDSQTYGLSLASGSMFIWDAGDGPTGEIVGFAREESTTDLATELTGLIQTQRAYSSNAKVIQTVDEMLQETTNIKR